MERTHWAEVQTSVVAAGCQDQDFKYMHTETEHTERKKELEYQMGKILTVMTSVISNHPCLSPFTNENDINLTIVCMCGSAYKTVVLHV